MTDNQQKMHNILASDVPVWKIEEENQNLHAWLLKVIYLCWPTTVAQVIVLWFKVWEKQV